MNTLSRVVTFTPLGLAAPAKDNESILDVARRLSVPLGNSCGGVGICARCRIRVVSGSDHLTAPTSVETRFARGFGEDERMACQAVVLGECEVTTTYW